MAVFARFWIDPDTGTHRPEDLITRGPALPVEVAVPGPLAAALTARAAQLPAPQPGTALIDTGASISAVDVEVIQRLGLNPVGSVEVITPSGTQTQSVYVVRLTFPGTPIPALEPRVTGSQLSGFGHAVLIGRDILEGGLLIYDGVHCYWTIAF